jgi:hypothetical protein
VTTSCFVLSSNILLLLSECAILAPCRSCWKGVNAQQNKSDIKPGDLGVVLLVIVAVAGDVGDFKESSDSTILYKLETLIFSMMTLCPRLVPFFSLVT